MVAGGNENAEDVEEKHVDRRAERGERPAPPNSLPPRPTRGIEQDDDQAEDAGRRGRDEEGQPSPDDLAQEDPVAGQAVGQHELERAVLLLAADGVVGKNKGGQAEKDGDDEDQIEQGEHDRQGIVVEILEVDVGGDAPDQGVGRGAAAGTAGRRSPRRLKWA